jgi:hypothetical protein
MRNNANMMLGRLPSAIDRRTLELKDFTTEIEPPTPDARLWQIPISDWGIMGNDRYGNCVIATAAHALLTWRANELKDTRRIADSAVVDLSRTMGALNGYNILDRLKYWRNVGMWANKIWAFAAVQPTDFDHVREAINTFGLLDIGINLPNAWRNADIWNTGSGRQYQPGTWGGHSVPIVGYDGDFLHAVSWGEIYKLTWPALEQYVDEAYAIIDRDWLAADAVAPSGYDLEAMHAALQEI